MSFFLCISFQTLISDHHPQATTALEIQKRVTIKLKVDFNHHHNLDNSLQLLMLIDVEENCFEHLQTQRLICEIQTKL